MTQLNITPRARRSIYLIGGALTFQAIVGISAVWQSVPIHLGCEHQFGAILVLSSCLLALNSCWKVDPVHIWNLLNKAKIEDPNLYQKLFINGKFTVK